MGFISRMREFITGRGNALLDPRVLDEMVDRAWIDNADLDQLFYTRGWARKRFNEVVRAYVVDYFARVGHLPEGNHFITSSTQRMIYFASRRLPQSSGLRSAALSNAA